MSCLNINLIKNWWTALLLIAGACLFPGRAHAECGDYLIIHKSQTSSEAQAITHQALNDHRLNPLETLRPFKAPCNGPRCSRLPSREPTSPPPTTTATFHTKVVANHVNITNELPIPNSLQSAPPSFHLPSPHSDPIFHPPRLSSGSKLSHCPKSIPTQC